jgi:hypothetical protein
MGIGRNFRRLAKWIAALLIALNGLAALYHTLVQYKVLEDRCKTTFRISDAAEYAALLGEKKETGCSKKSWTVGKIPAPFLNGAVCAWLLFRIYRDRD